MLNISMGFAITLIVLFLTASAASIVQAIGLDTIRIIAAVGVALCIPLMLIEGRRMARVFWE